MLLQRLDSLYGAQVQELEAQTGADFLDLLRHFDEDKHFDPDEFHDILSENAEEIIAAYMKLYGKKAQLGDGIAGVRATALPLAKSPATCFVPFQPVHW